MKKKTVFALFLLCLMLFTAGCRENTPVPENGFSIYFLNATKKELYPVASLLDPEWTFYQRVMSVWRDLATGGDRSTYVTPVPAGVSLNLKNFTFEDETLVLNFDQAYLGMAVSDEVLFRASVVKTFTGFPEVGLVEFRVEGQPLTLSNGTVVGAMKGSDFIDVFGSGLNAYSETEVRVYFTNEEGTKLVGEDVTVRYDNTVSLEQAVVRKLIDGPMDANLSPCLSGDTKLISVSTQNGCCYLNFTDTFLQDAIVRPEIAVYSIVNSLTEIQGIDSVLISVNGATPDAAFDGVDLTKPLYRNMNLNVDDVTTETPESE